MTQDRYYNIELTDDKKMAFIIRVKKDFYAEGISIDENNFLQGYFDFYHYLKLSILNNNSSLFEPKGLAGDVNKGISHVILDEEFIEYNVSCNFPVTITEITDEKIIAKINSLIEISIKSLNFNDQKIYNYLKNQRLKHFKKLKQEVETPIYFPDNNPYTFIENNQLNFTNKDLKEISSYLKDLNNKKKILKKKNSV